MDEMKEDRSVPLAHGLPVAADIQDPETPRLPVAGIGSAPGRLIEGCDGRAKIYKSLQASRAVAALLVLLLHLGGAIAAAKYFGVRAFAVPFSFGDAGVEFFFVLSGFIIYAAHRQDIGKPGHAPAYIVKRLCRIYPIYWLIFACVYASAVAVPSLRGSIPYDLTSVVKALFLIPLDRDVVGGTGAPVIVVAWTLQYEVLFYLFFAVMVLNRFAAVVGAALLLTAYAATSRVSVPPFPLSFLTRDYVFLFGMGMSVSWAHATRIRLPISSQVILAVGLLGFALVAADKVFGTDALANVRTLLYGGASSLILLGLVGLEEQGRIVGGQATLQRLGNASYVLYLIHYPLVSLSCKLAQAARVPALGLAGALASYVAIIFACVTLAIILHENVESRISRRLQRALLRKV